MQSHRSARAVLRRYTRCSEASSMLGGTRQQQQQPSLKHLLSHVVRTFTCTQGIRRAEESNQAAGFSPKRSKIGYRPLAGYRFGVLVVSEIGLSMKKRRDVHTGRRTKAPCRRGFVQTQPKRGIVAPTGKTLPVLRLDKA